MSVHAGSEGRGSTTGCKRFASMGAVTLIISSTRRSPSRSPALAKSSCTSRHRDPWITIIALARYARVSNWHTYSNTAYGFSYRYPTDWTTTGDSTYSPKISATRQEFGTGLWRTTTTQNSVTADGEPVPSNTVDFEVLDEPLQTAAAWYDAYYAQTPIKVNKRAGTLKGKQSVQYDFVAPTYETKQYLFAVGSKTHLFSSINESENVTASSTYWSDFDNTFASLTIQ